MGRRNDRGIPGARLTDSTADRQGSPGKTSLTQRMVRTRPAEIAPTGGALAPRLVDPITAAIQRRAIERSLDAAMGFFNDQLDTISGPVQRRADEHTGLDDQAIGAHAAHGIEGGGEPLPHLATIQRAFGPDHALDNVRAHVGGAAADASDAIGAHAYTTGDHIAFASQPDLFLAAHEATHVIQQRHGVSLKAVVGQDGDPYERHADLVAAAVVRGDDVASMLATGPGGTPAIARKTVEKARVSVTPDEVADPSEVAKLVAEAEAFDTRKGRKAKRKREDHPKAGSEEEINEWISDHDAPLAWVVFTLGAKSEAVQRAVLAKLAEGKTPLLDLLELSGLENLWISETAARAVATLVQRQPSERVVEDLLRLLKVGAFDWSVDRWESRLAWELFDSLPADQQAEFEKSWGDGRLGRKTRRFVRTERNMSGAYKDSSRYDTYDGDHVEKPATASELGAAKRNETDREALLAQTLDDALWAKGNPRLEGVLRMVIIADEAAFVADKVAAHWPDHEALFVSLGFDQTGAWHELVDDSQNAHWLRRLYRNGKVLASATSFFAAGAGYRRLATIDIRALEKAMADRFGIEAVEHTAPPKTQPADVLETLYATPGYVEFLRKALNIEAGALVEKLTGPGDVAGHLLAEAQGLQATNDDEAAKTDPSKDPVKDPVTLTRIHNDHDGSDHITLDNYAVAGFNHRFGDTTIKLGPSSLSKFDLLVQKGSAHDPTRQATLEIGEFATHDSVIVTPDRMYSIGALRLTGLHLTVGMPDQVMAGVAQKVLTDLFALAVQVLQQLPGGSVVALGEMLRGAAVSAAAFKSGIDYVTFGFGGVALENLVDSQGNRIDKLDIGKSQLDVNNYDDVMSAAAKLPRLSAAHLRARLAELKLRRERLAGKAERKAGKGKDTESVDEKIRDLDVLIDATQKQLDDAAERDAAQRKLEPLLKKRDDIKKQDPDGPARDAKLKPIQDQIDRLSRELAAIGVAGAEITGAFGKITAEGIDQDGMAAKSVSIDPLKATAQVGDGEGVAGEASTKDVNITIDEASYTAHERIDIALATEIAALKEKQAEKIATRDDLERLAKLEAEFARWKPVVAEYELLRSRLTDRERPMTAEQKARFAELEKRLHAPPDIEIAKLEAKGVDVATRAGDSPAPQGDEVVAAVHADSVTITGVKQTDAATGAETRVAKIEATDADIAIDAPNDVIAVGAKTVDVTGAAVDGAATTRQRETAATTAELTEVAAEIAELERRIAEENKRAAPDAAAIADWKARLALVVERRDALTGKATELDTDSALRSIRSELVTTIDGVMPKLVGADGVDRSRGFSLNSAVDGEAAEAQLVKELQSKGPVCVEVAKLRIDEYDAALLVWIAEHKAAKSAHDTVSAERLAAEIDSAREQRALWVDRQTKLLERQAVAIARQKDMARLVAEYRKLVKAAKSAKLVDDDAELGGMSAFDLKQAALAKNGEEADTSVAAVNAKGVSARIEGGLKSNGHGPIAVYSSDRDGTIDDVTITGVEAPNTKADSVHLTKLGAKAVYMLAPGVYEVSGLSIGRVGLGALSWQGVGYGIDIDANAALDGVEVTASIDTRGKDALATIKSFRVANLHGEGMKLLYDGMLFTFDRLDAKGEKRADGTWLAGVEVSDYDLSSSAFADISLRGLTSGNAVADLGAGFRFGAQSLAANKIKVGAAVTAKAKAKAAASGKKEEMNFVTTDIDGLDAKKVRTQMKADGVDVMVDEIKHANIKGLSVDFVTGEFTMQNFAAPIVNIGTVGYTDPHGALTVKVGKGIALTGVRLNAKGKLGFDEEAAATERKAGKVPQFIQSLRFEHIHADTGVFDGLSGEYATLSDTTRFNVPHAWAKNIDIRGYDFITNAMSISLDDGGADGVSLAFSDALGTLSTWGSYTIDHLKADLDDQGGMDLSLKNLMSGKTADGKPVPTAIGTDPKSGDGSGATAVIGATSGTITTSSGGAVRDQPGDRDAAGESKVGFNLALKDLNLESLYWSAGTTAVESSDGPIVLRGATAQGYAKTEMVKVTEGGATALLPQATLHIDTLHVDKIEAKNGVKVTTNGVAAPIAAEVANVDVYDLDKVGSDWQGGVVEIDRVDARVPAGQFAIAEKIKDGIRQKTAVGGGVTASAITIVRAGGVTTTDIGEVEVMKAKAWIPVRQTESAELDLPHAKLTGVHNRTTTDKATATGSKGASATHVDEAKLLEDATISIPNPPKKEDEDEESGKPPLSTDEGPDLITLLSSLNGTLGANLMLELHEKTVSGLKKFSPAAATLKITNGVINDVRLSSTDPWFALYAAGATFAEKSLVDVVKEEVYKMPAAPGPGGWRGLLDAVLSVALEPIIKSIMSGESIKYANVVSLDSKLALGPYANPVRLGDGLTLQSGKAISLSASAGTGEFPAILANLLLSSAVLTIAKDELGTKSTRTITIGGSDLGADLAVKWPDAEVIVINKYGLKGEHLGSDTYRPKVVVDGDLDQQTPTLPDPAVFKIKKGGTITDIDMTESHTYTRPK